MKNVTCISLVKTYHRNAMKGTLAKDQALQIQQTLIDRINTGTADRKLFLFLNRLTNSTIIRRYVDFRKKQHFSPEKLEAIFQLYECLIEAADSLESVPYLLHALQSTCSTRTNRLKYQFRRKLLSEHTEEESGPDQCGHINQRFYHYKEYLVESHYMLRRPLVEKARERLGWIVNRMAGHRQHIYDALQQSRNQERRGEFGVEVKEETLTELDHVDIIGDSGYW